MAYQFVPKRILVVDDNCDAADLTAQLLALHGHIAFVAYGGKQGIEAAIDFIPDVVLLDLGMPEVDGFAVAIALRQMPALQQPSLIAYTAWSDARTLQRTRSVGFDQHMIKPAKVEDILAMVSSAPNAV